MYNTSAIIPYLRNKHILLCHAATSDKQLSGRLCDMAKLLHLTVHELCCEDQDFTTILSLDSNNPSLAAIVALDDAGKAVLQIHDVPKLLFNPVLTFDDQEERRRVMRSATSFDEEYTWAIFTSEEDNETHYETMHQYSINLSLQMATHTNMDTIGLRVLSFLCNANKMINKRLAAAETIDEYLERLGHAPLLSIEEEKELLSKAQHDDSEAMQILKFANERFIVSLVNAYRTPLNVTDASSFMERVRNLVREMDQIIIGYSPTSSGQLMGFLIGVLMHKYGLESKIDRFMPVGEDWKEEAMRKLAEENMLTTPALLASLSDREKAITCMWYGIGCARHSVEDIAEIGLLTPQRVQRIMDRIKIKLTE